MVKGFSNLYRKIIKKGLCTGCGSCVAVCSTRAIQFDFEKEEPCLMGSCEVCGLCSIYCPGGDIPLLKLEKKFFGKTRAKRDEILGVSKAFLKGYAKDPEIRQRGASGGLTTALLLYALDRKIINGAMVTKMDRSKPWRTEPTLARTREELIEAAKSKYAICPNNIMLREAEEAHRLAVVGLPCHIHGIRKIQSNKELPKLAERIVLVLGIFCGSNWSYKITEHMIREYSDVEFGEIERFEYRGGEDSQDVKILTRHGKDITITNAERRMIFQCTDKERCPMCCDWAVELSDLSFGDIFDPLPRGSTRKIPNWNSVIVQTESGMRLIEEARKSGAIEISALEENSFYGNMGFELKKHGAVYAWKERKKCGWPTPNYHYEFPWEPKRKQLYEVPEI